ncbi:MAG TPA: cell wall hydrolase [Rhizomicrobium sp.]|jgi:spore germination cell wall hydrolase CwlJ-like protein|nr:cell wall hydrolase [Rhizomicrobium sp.]
MAKRIGAAARRADLMIAGFLALTFAAAAAAAGAAAIGPSTDKNVQSASFRQIEVAPLPLRLAQADPATTFVSPPPMSWSTAPISFAPDLADPALERMLAEQRCLAEAMYYEARGEGVDGEKAIAEVVFHRMKSARYPHSVCGVVYQGAALKHACQFSFTCSGELQQRKTPGAWARAKRLAAKILGGLVQLGDITEDAISFHAVDVEPGWGDHLVKTIQIGNHVFYRSALPATQGS